MTTEEIESKLYGIATEAWNEAIDAAIAAVPRERDTLDKDNPDNYGACYAIGGFNHCRYQTIEALNKLKRN